MNKTKRQKVCEEIVVYCETIELLSYTTEEDKNEIDKIDKILLQIKKTLKEKLQS